MTSPLAGLGSSPTTPVRDRQEMGRDQFLSLLVTQLRHQDPLNPLAPDAFAAQLAQFSSVEQLTQLNKAFDAQQADSIARTLLDKTNLGASLIGRHVVAEGNQLVVSGGSTSFQAEIASPGGRGTLTLYDKAGNVVATRDLGTLRGGLQTVNPPGGLPSGVHHYSVQVEDPNGENVAVRTYTQGVVDGVSFEGGQVLLRIGSIRVPLDRLSEITPLT